MRELGRIASAYLLSRQTFLMPPTRRGHTGCSKSPRGEGKRALSEGRRSALACILFDGTVSYRTVFGLRRWIRFFTQQLRLLSSSVTAILWGCADDCSSSMPGDILIVRDSNHPRPMLCHVYAITKERSGLRPVPHLARNISACIATYRRWRSCTRTSMTAAEAGSTDPTPIRLGMGRIAAAPLS